MISCIHLETVVQRAHDAIQQINHHPVESVNKIFCVIHRIDLGLGTGLYCTDKFSVPLEWRDIHLETVVQRAHDAIQQINHHPVESVNKIFCVIHRIDLGLGSGLYCTDKFSVPLEWRDILTGHFL